MRRMILALLSVVLWWVVSVPVEAASPLAVLDQRIEQQVQQKTHAQSSKNKGFTTQQSQPASPTDSAGLTARQQQIVQALDKIRLTPKDLNEVTNWMFWSDFVSQSKQIAEQIEGRLQKYKQSLTKQEQKMEKYLQQNFPFTWKYARPDYGWITQQTSLIYLTDASSHSTNSAVEEVKKVMQSVRKFNPHARILLALEFVAVADFATPIRFARKPNKEMYIDSPYDQLLSQADLLDMDVLALEDNIAFADGKAAAVKIGRYFLGMDSQDHPDFIKDVSNINEQEWQQLDGYVASSSLGMYLRNEQWSSYLRAVKPLYDVVIVYAGAGHVASDEEWMNVPEMVGAAYMEIHFVTKELNDSYVEYALSNEKLTCDSHVCAILNDDTEIRKDLPKWDEKRIMYIKVSNLKFREYIRSLSADEQAIYRRLEQKQKKGGFNSLEPSEVYFVYLPQ